MHTFQLPEGGGELSVNPGSVPVSLEIKTFVPDRRQLHGASNQFNETLKKA